MPRWKSPSPPKSCAPAAHCASVAGGLPVAGGATHSAALPAGFGGLDCASPWAMTVVRQRADNTLPSSRRNRLISLPVTSLLLSKDRIRAARPEFQRLLLFRTTGVLPDD